MIYSIPQPTNSSLDNLKPKNPKPYIPPPQSDPSSTLFSKIKVAGMNLFKVIRNLTKHKTTLCSKQTVSRCEASRPNTINETSLYEEAGLNEQDVAASMQQGLSKEEVQNAALVKIAHDEVEIAAYHAFVENVVTLNITTDCITKELSRQLLFCIKKAAHIPLRAKGGYCDKHNQFISEAQKRHLISNLAIIIHDRDRRLTHGSYTSLTELLFALDDHNTLVNEILFKSWWGCRVALLQSHLNLIKKKVSFYRRLQQQLSFDIQEALHIRFNKGQEIRSHFQQVTLDRQFLSYITPNAGLVAICKSSFKDVLRDRLSSPQDESFLLKKEIDPKKITVENFFKEYFPNIIF